MRKYLVYSLIIIGIIVFIGSLYGYITTQQANNRLTTSIKSSVVSGVIDTSSELTSYIDFIQISNPDDLEKISGLIDFIQETRIVERNTRILKKNYTQTNEETKIIDSIHELFYYLHRFASHSTTFFETKRPFNTCDNIEFNNVDNILEEFRKYEAFLTIDYRSEPLESWELWNGLIDDWSIEEANEIYRCDM